MKNFDGREAFLVSDDVFVASFKSIETDVFGDVEVDNLISLDFEKVKFGIVLKSH